ncbi:393_t:CDS:2 [Gigaspora margarita]|uniref:393_t:CDS:1 n=1 Tax=Gigaspora margarita TaxID=4874 RepID=A0ABM8VWZ2_GIGMA|nr:393_t:CDS:2 [Gigaspora margarita]
MERICYSLITIAAQSSQGKNFYGKGDYYTEYIKEKIWNQQKEIHRAIIQGKKDKDFAEKKIEAAEKEGSQFSQGEQEIKEDEFDLTDNLEVSELIGNKKSRSPRPSHVRTVSKEDFEKFVNEFNQDESKFGKKEIVYIDVPKAPVSVRFTKINRSGNVKKREREELKNNATQLFPQKGKVEAKEELQPKSSSEDLIKTLVQQNEVLAKEKTELEKKLLSSRIQELASKIGGHQKMIDGNIEVINRYLANNEILEDQITDSLSSSHLLTHLTTGANMLTITTTTSTTTEGLLYTSASADNHLTNTQELLVPIGGGVALLISVFVILSVFSLVYCPKRRRARVMEELQENQPGKYQKLTIKYNKLEGKLDLSDFINLERLDCSHNELTDLDISKCSNLKRINCSYNFFGNLDFLNKLPNSENLTRLNIVENGTFLQQKETIKILTLFSNLEEIGIDKIHETLPCILQQSPKAEEKIKNLERNQKIDGNYPRDGICKIETTGLEDGRNKSYNNTGKRREEITKLNISRKNLEGHLDLQGFSNLEEFLCRENQLTSLNLSGCPNLTLLNCVKNKLTKLDLTDNSKLEVVNVYGNEIGADLNIFSRLDLSRCQNLESLTINKQRQITGELENELEIERNHAKNMDNHYRNRILKPAIEERDQLKKENQELKNKLELAEGLLRKLELEQSQQLEAKVEISPK